jgi:hypothetical protein
MVGMVDEQEINCIAVNCLLFVVTNFNTSINSDDVALFPSLAELLYGLNSIEHKNGSQRSEPFLLLMNTFNEVQECDANKKHQGFTACYQKQIIRTMN